MEERDYEQEATVQGWKSEGELDAKAFVEKGEKIAGLQKKKADRLVESNEELTRRVASLESSNREFGESQKKQQDKLKRENARLLGELEAKRSEAITAGDGAEFTRIDREIDSVKEDLREPLSNGLDQLAAQWLTNNQWYNTNENLRIYADGLASVVSNEGYRDQAYYKELTRRVKDQFPQEFENPNQDKSTSVEQGGQIDTPASKSAKTYDNLPKDAKASCDRFVANGLMSKKDYVSAYEWE